MKNLAYKNSLTFIFILNLCLIALIFVVQSFLPPEVPLLYGLPKGEEQLIPKLLLFLPGLTAEVVLVINALLINFLRDDFLKKSLFYIVIASSALAIIATLKVVFLVGSF